MSLIKYLKISIPSFIMNILTAMRNIEGNSAVQLIIHFQNYDIP